MESIVETKEEQQQAGDKVSKRRKISTFLDYPGNEWLINEEQALRFCMDFLHQILHNNHLQRQQEKEPVEWNEEEDRKSLKIFLPGVGRSKIGWLLFQQGFESLSISDIEPEAIAHQLSLFQQEDSQQKERQVKVERDQRNIHIFQADMFELKLNEFPVTEFDVILDKGFLDVFNRQGGAQRVFQNLQQLFRQQQGQQDHPRQSNCYFIAFSMFHRKWKSLFVKPKKKQQVQQQQQQQEWPLVWYTSVNVERFSRTRPTVKQFSNPIAVLFAVSPPNSGSVVNFAFETNNHGDGIVVMAEHTFQNFHKISSNQFPNDASYF